jgi:serine/threonine-protein kinase
MERDDRSRRRTLCPSDEVLRAFGLGEWLPEADVDAVATHIDYCPDCGAALDRVHESTNSLLAQMRALRDVGTVPEPPSSAPGRSTVPKLPFQMGRYELLKELGHGGMSVVYEARQEWPPRPVAVKMLHRWFTGPDALARLRAEVDAVGRLQHPAIVHVYDYGEQEGRPYFVMEYLPGGTLAGRLKEGPLPQREAAEAVRTLALATHAAHQKGVVHRDLKPANVLLDGAGRLKIADFGVAVLADNAEWRKEAEGTLVGTPAYMAPEQARGESAAIGIPSDVYGLGAILYEALTGRPPFTGATQGEILDQVRTRQPVLPSRLRRGLSWNLEAICLRCLEKKADQRYTSAAELADDLSNWLEGKPIRARPLGRLGRTWLTVRRRARLALAALVAGAILVLLAALPRGKQPEPPDPDQPIRDIEARLASRQSVELIGEKGGPPWRRWVEDNDSGTASVRADGTFTATSWGLNLLELLGETPCERFRLRAEVRQNNATAGTAEVGLYWGHRTYSRQGVPVSHWTQISLNETKGKVSVLPNLYCQQSGKFVFGHRFDGPSAPLPKRVSQVWRRLEVEVTPDWVRAYLLQGEERTRVGELQTDSSRKQTEAVGRLRDVDPFLRAIDPSPPRRGGLGLLLFNGSGSFRDVVIEPLPDTD